MKICERCGGNRREKETEGVVYPICECATKPDISDEEVWLRAWCAVISACHGQWTEHQCLEVADSCLEEFKKRFRKAPVTTDDGLLQADVTVFNHWHQNPKS